MVKPKIDRDIQIVKVQRPVVEFGEGGPPPVLIYDERHKHRVNVHYADLPVWLAKALETTPKLFVRAVWIGTGWEFVGQRQAAWQPW